MSKLINCGYSGCIQAQRIKTGITSSWLLNLFFKYKSKTQTMFQYVNKNIQFAINVIVIQKDVLCSCCCLFFIGLVKKVLSLFWDGRTPIFFYQWCFFFFFKLRITAIILKQCFFVCPYSSWFIWFVLELVI